MCSYTIRYYPQRVFVLSPPLTPTGRVRGRQMWEGKPGTCPGGTVLCGRWDGLQPLHDLKWKKNGWTKILHQQAVASARAGTMSKAMSLKHKAFILLPTACIWAQPPQQWHFWSPEGSSAVHRKVLLFFQM